MSKFADLVTEAVHSLEMGVELKMPGEKYSTIPATQTGFAKAAVDRCLDPFTKLPSDYWSCNVFVALRIPFVRGASDYPIQWRRALAHAALILPKEPQVRTWVLTCCRISLCVQRCEGTLRTNL